LDRRTTAFYGGSNELVPSGIPLSVTAMSEAYWEMERLRMMGNRAREIEGYAALEYPRESVAAVLRMLDVPTKSSGWRLRGPRPGRSPAPVPAPRTPRAGPEVAGAD
jgi:hypothetical protein